MTNIFYVPRDAVIVRERRSSPSRPRRHHHGALRARLCIPAADEGLSRRLSTNSLQQTIYHPRGPTPRRASLSALGARVLRLGSSDKSHDREKDGRLDPIFTLHGQNTETDLRRRKEQHQHDKPAKAIRPKAVTTMTDYETARRQLSPNSQQREKFKRQISAPFTGVPVPGKHIVAKHEERTEAWRKRDLLTGMSKSAKKTWRERASLRPYQRYSVFKEWARTRVVGVHGGNTLAKAVPLEIGQRIVAEAEAEAERVEPTKHQPPVRPARWTKYISGISASFVQMARAERREGERMHQGIDGRDRSGPEQSRMERPRKDSSGVRARPEPMYKGPWANPQNTERASHTRDMSAPRSRPVMPTDKQCRVERQSASYQDMQRALRQPRDSVAQGRAEPVADGSSSHRHRRSVSVRDLGAQQFRRESRGRARPGIGMMRHSESSPPRGRTGRSMERKRHSASSPPPSVRISESEEHVSGSKSAQSRMAVPIDFTDQQRALYAQQCRQKQALRAHESKAEHTAAGEAGVAAVEKFRRSKRYSASVQDLSLHAPERHIPGTIKKAASHQAMRSDVEVRDYHHPTVRQSPSATSVKDFAPHQSTVHGQSTIKRATSKQSSRSNLPCPTYRHPAVRAIARQPPEALHPSMRQDAFSTSASPPLAPKPPAREPSASTLCVTPPSTLLQPTVYRSSPSPAPNRVVAQQLHLLCDPPSELEQNQLLESINRTRTSAGAAPVQLHPEFSKHAQHFAGFELKPIAPPKSNSKIPNPSGQRARTPEPKATQVVQGPDRRLETGTTLHAVLLVSPPNLGTLACGEKWASGKVNRHKHVTKGLKPGTHRYTMFPAFAMNGSTSDADAGSLYSQDSDGETVATATTEAQTSHTDCSCFEHDAWTTVVDKRWSFIGIGKAGDGRWAVKSLGVTRETGEGISVRQEERAGSGDGARTERSGTPATTGGERGAWTAERPGSLTPRPLVLGKKTARVVSVASEGGYYDSDIF